MEKQLKEPTIQKLLEMEFDSFESFALMEHEDVTTMNLSPGQTKLLKAAIEEQRSVRLTEKDSILLYIPPPYEPHLPLETDTNMSPPRSDRAPDQMTLDSAYLTMPETRRGLPEPPGLSN